MATRVMLHYGGREYRLPENQATVIRGLDPDQAGVISLNLGGENWLSFVYGPGIPIALIEEQYDPQERKMTVL